MIVAWTGHRPDLFLDPTAAQMAVQAAAGDVVHEGVSRFLVGGQRGVDTWAACVAIDRAIPFVMVLPGTRSQPAPRGGTAETIEFAQQAGTPVREIILEPSPQAKSARGRRI